MRFSTPSWLTRLAGLALCAAAFTATPALAVEYYSGAEQSGNNIYMYSVSTLDYYDCAYTAYCDAFVEGQEYVNGSLVDYTNGLTGYHVEADLSDTAVVGNTYTIAGYHYFFNSNTSSWDNFGYDTAAVTVYPPPPPTPTPQISGISPDIGVVGIPGYIAIYGYYLSGNGAWNDVYVWLDGAYRQVVYVSDGQINVYYSSVTLGTHTLYVGTSGGWSNGVNFTVGTGDPTPAVSSFSPTNFQYNQSNAMTISGSGFGTSPSVFLSYPDGASEWASVTNAADTLIYATAYHHSTLSGSIAVTVYSNGYWGSGFIPSYSGQPNYVMLAQASHVTAQTQAIAFASLNQVMIGSGSVALSATATSGLPVIFTSTTPATCSVAGSTATVLSVGTCSISANQAGNSVYLPAPTVTRSFAISVPTVQLTDLTRQGPPFYAGDNYTITVSGAPSSVVTVSQNSGPQSSVGMTNSLGVLIISGLWTLADVGDYTRTYYVAGYGASTASFQVGANGQTVTCGRINPDLYIGSIAAGTNLAFAVPAAGAATVSFLIGGPNIQPYSASVGAVRTQYTSTWSANVDTTGLSGAYSVTPIITSPAGQTSCSAATHSTAYFEIRSSATPPSQPGSVPCSSLTGNWTAVAPNRADFSLQLTDNNGSISGHASYTYACSVAVNFSSLSGTYVPSSGRYDITAAGPTPTVFACGGNVFRPLDYHVTGTIGASCGAGSGTATAGYDYFTQTMTTERIPSSENSVASSPAWSVANQTVAVFTVNMITGTSDPAYIFGGRTVTELNPGPGDVLPADYVGNDGCYWPGGPWPTPITRLSSNDSWNVQGSTSGSPHGSYGPDFMGLAHPATLAYVQTYAPQVATPGGSCTIKYPQKMVINTESTTTGTEPYGGPGSGLNLVQMTITPTTFTVQRGSGTISRENHF